MRYITIAATLVLVLVLTAPGMVLADDYVTDAVQALQRAPVYVAPGTEGTDHNTASKLQARLKTNDNIVLVMLPAAAEKELGTDTFTIASRLSEMLGNQRIIGLAVGNKVVGYAPTLPSGLAADQMRRAQSVSNDPVTALGTFAQNVHLWQAERPIPTPTSTPKPPPPPPPQSGGISWLVWVLVLAGIALFTMVGSTVAARRHADQASTTRTRFKAPNQISDLLSIIAREREQISDRELRDALYQMCVDIERYFRSSSNNKERDSVFFKERLTEVTKVLAKYIEVQDGPRYYNEPDVQLHRGKEAITDFCQYVLESIRRGNAADLLDYTVNTKILQAQRYR